ncbi:MAG: nicotinate phosphoribosyltransferase [Deltaproteobacteria bacterium]|nr:nicotinate phosphoribosyltransferase [Deltaproteobacteria bacterium]
MCDGYKLDHRRQFPAGTQRIYSNFTPRSSRVDGQDKVVFFGLQYFLSEYLGRIAAETFFARPKAEVLDKYQRLLDSYFGPNTIGVNHIAALHDYGRIPLQFWALPEGTHVPLRCAMFTLMNTHDDFYWMTNYVETMLSSVIWHACTSATTAHRYRKLLDAYAARTGGSREFVQWQGHDFSFRGLSSPEVAAISGAAHLLSFTGTDTVPAIQLLQEHYDGTGLIGGSVPATEHAVMCAGERDSELGTFTRLLELYPTGIVSVVSDTWDLWNVVDNTLPALKDRIMGRDGKLVIRPDSGVPEDILCGDPNAPRGSTANEGLIQALWRIFGGTVNERGFKQLDPHIGAIYGDSITEKRAEEICRRLEANGFASTNVVLGIGSFTYQYVTRDTYGFAIKATWAKVNGEGRDLYKDPATDDGVKKSARGLLSVVNNNGKLEMREGLNSLQLPSGEVDLLAPVWNEGKFLRRQSLEQVRAHIRADAE